MDISIVPTDDMLTVKAVVAMPDIWEEIVDGDIAPEQFTPFNDDVSQWLLVYAGKDLAGVILMQRENTVTLRHHPYLLKPYRHIAREMMAIFYRIVLSFEEINKLIATIPDYNRKLYNFTKKVGFKSEGFSPESVIKDGELYGSRYIGITRAQIEEWLEARQ